MRKKILKNIPILVMVMLLTSSCVDKDYDLDKTDYSGVWDGEITLPVGTLNKTAEKFLTELDPDNPPTSWPVTFNGPKQLIAVDFLDCDLTDDDVAENVRKVVVWMDYKNSFTKTVTLDVKFFANDDENGNRVPILGNIFLDQNPNNEIIPTGNEFKKDAFQLEFDERQINPSDPALRVRYLEVTMVMDIPAGESVDIYENEGYSFKLKAYGQGSYHFNLKD